MKASKIIIYLALIVGLVSGLQYICDSLYDSVILAGKTYAAKQDYVEKEYNGYMVYRYYSWLETRLNGREYGLVVSAKDDSSYDRYRHRMNYFLYPKRIVENSNILFAPRADMLKKTEYRNGKAYSLRYTMDRTGVYISK